MGLKTRMELCKKVSSNKTRQCIKKEKKKLENNATMRL